MATPIKIGKDLFCLEMRLKEAGSVDQAKLWSVDFWNTVVQLQPPIETGWCQQKLQFEKDNQGNKFRRICIAAETEALLADQKYL